MVQNNIMVKSVKVEWVDSCTSNQNWFLLSDKLDEDIIRITTYGFLIQETDEFITIAQNYGEEPEQVCNLILIPKGCVKSIIDIK